jgi:hypothetical protein
MSLTFQYSVLNAAGALVSTCPTKAAAYALANKYGGTVLRDGRVIYRVKSLLAEKGA